MSAEDTKPYLLRALYEWCCVNNYTPYISVHVDKNTRVPMEYTLNGEIVLNISLDAVTQLEMGNDFILFTARFKGKPYQIDIPVGNVLTIYAQENGQGMAFPVDVNAEQSPEKVKHSIFNPRSHQMAEKNKNLLGNTTNKNLNNKSSHLKIIK